MTHTLTLRPGWSPLTIVLMVIGFLIAWPIGLIVLAYILWGDRIPEFRRMPGATPEVRAMRGRMAAMDRAA